MARVGRTHASDYRRQRGDGVGRGQHQRRESGMWPVATGGSPWHRGTDRGAGPSRRVAFGGPWRRKRITVTDPALVRTLEAVVADDTRGDPQSPLRWTCKSTRALARTMTRRHHRVSHAKVGQLLRGLGQQSAEQSEDRRRARPRGPRRAVSAHQHGRHPASRRWRAGDLGRYQEERTSSGTT